MTSVRWSPPLPRSSVRCGLLHDFLRDLGWPAREGTAYYSALVNDEACLVTLARDGGHVAGHLIGKLSGPTRC